MSNVGDLYTVNSLLKRHSIVDIPGRSFAISARNVAITKKCLKGSVQSREGGGGGVYLPSVSILGHVHTAQGTN